MHLRLQCRRQVCASPGYRRRYCSSSPPSPPSLPRHPLKLINITNFPLSLPRDHRFPIGTWDRVSQVLRSEYNQEQILWENSTLAPPEILKLVHEESYLARFIGGTMSESEVRELGFSWNEKLVARQRAQVGATVRAAELVLSGEEVNGVVGVVGGGLHHAKRAKASGYCALNDLAVAAQYALEKFHVKRVLVVDLDVHQGDGTASIFENEPRVVTFSMHARKNFPFRKAISTHDVELEDSVSDHEYLKLLRHWLEHLLRLHQPQLILYQSGVDALKGDKLGKLSLSRECLRERTVLLLNILSSHSPLSKLVITMGGGYAAELSVEAHCDVFRATIDHLARRHSFALQKPSIIEENKPLW